MKLLMFFFIILNLSIGQDDIFRYELDLTIKNDAFNVTLYPPSLGNHDNIYQFVSHAPGAHQNLDFGRFVKSFSIYDIHGNELISQKISINQFKILEPEKVYRIVYQIDDSFDMSVDHDPIYPMSGTGISSNYTLINTFGVFGYFENLKNNPIELIIKLIGKPKIGTALNQNSEGVFLSNSFYHLADSPILIGENLTYASTNVSGIKVEAYVYSPIDKINAIRVLKEAESVLKAAREFIGFSPVDRYSFLMIFSDQNERNKMPVLQFGGALEHSLSSTYTLPANLQFLPQLKNIIAHEFMHIISPLYLKSNILANFDFSKAETEDLHLWLYEGVTEWVSFAMQVRAGDKTLSDYFSYLSEKLKRSQTYNSAYSLTRLSKEWSTKNGNKQYGNIYQLGALTAAMLDFKLIELSNAEKDLRKLYLGLIAKFGKNKPFDNSTFFDVLVELTYPEIRTFIDDHIRDNKPFDFKAELAKIGLIYIEKRQNISKVPSMGIALSNGQIDKFIDNYNGQNLKIRDKVISIDGIKFGHSSYFSIMAHIENKKIGDSYTIQVQRGEEILHFKETLVPKFDLHIFSLDKRANETTLSLQKGILSKTR